MPTRIIDLPKTEWRDRCLEDANAIRELSLHLDMCREDGDPPEQMTVRKILQEARDCLGYFENGTAADLIANGDKQALRDRRELRAFLRKWIPRLVARAAMFRSATTGK